MIKYNKEFCINELKRLKNEYGKVTNKILKQYGKVSSDTLKRRFGSLADAYKEAGIELKRGQRKFTSKEEIDKEIFRILDVYGYVSKPLFEKYSEYSPKIVQRIYGSFSNMYKELGIKRSPNGRIPTDEDLINECKKIYEKQGYLSYDLIEKFGEFSITCYKDRARVNNWDGINYYRKIIGCPIPTLGWAESPSAKYAIEKFSKYLNEEPEKEKTFDWLYNKDTNTKLRIDAYYEKANIAIEYNGPQHYYIDGLYTKTEKDLEYRQKLDFLKYQLIKAHNIKLIVIHFKDIVDQDYIKEKITQ